MTQKELDKILDIQAAQGNAFFSLLKEIEMPEESRTKVNTLFAVLQGFTIKTLKNNVASDLEFPEDVNKICEELNAMDEEVKNQEQEK